MGARLVIVADPTAEGSRLAERLRRRGFVVDQQPFEEPEGTGARPSPESVALVIVALDVEGSSAWLARWALESVGVIAIVAGRQGGGLLEPPPGVDAVYRRSAPLDRIVRKVETLLAPAETRLRPFRIVPVKSDSDRHPTTPPRMANPHGAVDVDPPLDASVEEVGVEEPGAEEPGAEERGAEVTGAEVTGAEEGSAPEQDTASGSRSLLSIVAPPVREPTLQLTPEDLEEASIGWPDGSASGGEGTPNTPSDEELGGARLSPHLERLFADADRRLFPTSAPMVLRFAAGDESARELVPDEILESAVLPMEPLDGDPLDAFTYLGAPPERPADAVAKTPARSLGYGPEMTTTEPGLPRRSAVPQGAPEETGPMILVSGTTPGLPGSTAPELDAPPAPPEHLFDVLVARAEEQARRLAVATPSSSEPSSPAQGTATERAVARANHGSFDTSSVIRMLFALAAERATVRVELVARDGLRRTVIDLEEGEPVRVAGDVALRAYNRLLRTGRLAADGPIPIDGVPVVGVAIAGAAIDGAASGDIAIDDIAIDEVEAASRLEAAVATGAVTRLELDRIYRQQREALIYDLLLEAELRYSIAEPTSTGLVHERGARRALGMGLRPALMEGARRRVGLASLTARVGDGVLRVLRTATTVSESAELEPEMVALIERMDGSSLAIAVESVPSSDGLAGVIFVLLALGGLEIAARGGERRTDRRDPARAVRLAVEAAHRLGEDGHYYDILGVPGSADEREIRVAYDRRRDELTDHDLMAHGLPDLEPLREEALDALDEAWFVLGDKRLREPYRRALGV